MALLLRWGCRSENAPGRGPRQARGAAAPHFISRDPRIVVLALSGPAVYLPAVEAVPVHVPPFLRRPRFPHPAPLLGGQPDGVPPCRVERRPRAPSGGADAEHHRRRLAGR